MWFGTGLSVTGALAKTPAGNNPPAFHIGPEIEVHIGP